VRPGSRVVALSVLTGEEHPISTDELELLLAIPESEWIVPPASSEAALQALAEHGVVVIDDEREPYADLRRREETLRARHWHPHAALFHAMTRWRDVQVAVPFDIDELPPIDARNDADPAPPPFATSSRGERVRQLSLRRRSDGLFGTLARRRTTRAFDPRTALTEEQLATLLDAVFGCRGTLDVDGEHVALRKTSPSGGGLHPTEVYPLLLRVEGFEPGLYHYDVGNHALEQLTRTTLAEAEELASEFTSGQRFVAAAGALFVMTARFSRSFWKYRRHERAYGTLFLDAGHLSQTLYLVAAELGLGAFVTGAINGVNVEELLALDLFEEGAIAICACGVPADGASPLEPEFEPYDPGRPA
jgi:putative peptide maturation dehydrogenase